MADVHCAAIIIAETQSWDIRHLPRDQKVTI